MLLTVVSLVVVLGVLISVHEFGHFIVAKTVGVQVLRFSLGFGRPLIAWRRGETEYWIAWIPLGGYVKMAGLEDEGMAGELEGGKSSVPIDPARSFDQQPLWARMAVIVAGVTMNVVLAFVIYAGLGAIMGQPRLATTRVDSVYVDQLPASAHNLALLQPGDQIVRINGDTIRTWDDVASHFLSGPTDVRIEIAGRAEPVVVSLPVSGDARIKALAGLAPLIPPRLGVVNPGHPAAKAGLKPRDMVLRAGGDTVTSWNQLLHKIWYSPGKPLPLTISRRGEILQLTVVPEATTETDTSSVRPHIYGLIGAYQDPPILRQRVSLGTALADGIRMTGAQIASVAGVVKRLVIGKASPQEVGGPILIAQMSGQAAQLGLDAFLVFVAAMSISLAVLNLLPIPVLDGGHLMFLIAEGIRRKPLSAQLRLRLTQAGMLVVLAIMVLAISNDVLRFFR